MKYALRSLPTVLLLATTFALSGKLSPAYPIANGDRATKLRDLKKQLHDLHEQMEAADAEQPPSPPRGIGR